MSPPTAHFGHPSKVWVFALLGPLAAACAPSSTTDLEGAATKAGTAGESGGECPPDGIRGSGRHRLFVQGHEGTPRKDGTYPFLHEAPPGGDAQLCDDTVFTADENGDGIWQPGETPLDLGPTELVHGEHFLVGAGSFAEFSATLCDDITGDIVFYIPNYDETGSEALHQLFVVHDGGESLIGDAVDDEAGESGYNPFIRVVSGHDPEVVAGDTLLLRSTNLTGVAFSVMVWQPPSEYESWILVNVP